MASESINDYLIEEFLQDANYYIGVDWKIYTNRPKSGPIGKKIYPWRNITRISDCGYEYFTYKGKYLKSHRVIFRFYNGYIDERQINHKDGNKQNNDPFNLELTTDQENKEHAKKHNLVAYGERASSATLTENQVKQIKQLLKLGVGVCNIARQFNTNHSYISKIKAGKSWKRLTI